MQIRKIRNRSHYPKEKRKPIKCVRYIAIFKSGIRLMLSESKIISQGFDQEAVPHHSPNTILLRSITPIKRNGVSSKINFLEKTHMLICDGKSERKC